LSDAVERAVRAPARPIERYFNRRFEDVHGHLDNEAVAVNAQLEQTLATTRALAERVATDVEVVSELALRLERLVERLDERVDALVTKLEQLIAREMDASGPPRR
jgi:regulator of replication initiation timing